MRYRKNGEGVPSVLKNLDEIQDTKIKKRQKKDRASTTPLFRKLSLAGLEGHHASWDLPFCCCWWAQTVGVYDNLPTVWLIYNSTLRDALYGILNSPLLRPPSLLNGASAFHYISNLSLSLSRSLSTWWICSKILSPQSHTVPVSTAWNIMLHGMNRGQRKGTSGWEESKPGYDAGTLQRQRMHEWSHDQQTIVQYKYCSSYGDILKL